MYAKFSNIVAITVASASGGAGTPVTYIFGRPIADTNAGVPNNATAFLWDLVELFVTSTGAGGAGTPTLDAKLQASADGTNWVDANIALPQITSASATTKVATGTRGQTATGEAATSLLRVILGYHLRVILTAGSASGTETFTIAAGGLTLVCRSLGE